MKKTTNQLTMVVTINSISVAFIILTIISFMRVMYLTDKCNKAGADRFELTYNANRFMDGSAYLTNEVRAFAATGNIIHYNNYWNEINVAKNRDIGVARMKEIGITKEEEAKIDAMAALSNNLVPLESDAMDKTKEGLFDEAIEDVYGEAYRKWIGEILSTKNEFLTMLDARAVHVVDDLTTRSHRMQIVTLVFIVFIVILQLINVYSVLVKTIYPIKELQKEMEEVAKGNLSSELSLTPDTSEIGRLTNSVIEIKNNLATYIGDISVKLKHIADGNLDIDLDIDYIGDFEPIQLSLIKILDSLNNAFSQIQNSTNQVSSGSSQVAVGAQVLARGASEQAASVEKLSSSVASVAERTESSANLAQEAVIHSNSIRKVIGVIAEIASQTNIIALNASVEAARAGKHGSAFVVVAKEVRNLAQKTAKSLEDIKKGLDESARLINEIANAAKEQSMSINNINTDIGQVSTIVQQNSATSEESASASEEMSAQAEMLQALVSHFKLKE
ncbi:MAG: methyl-accepting chemotaxis protein [Marinilabiliaceae bacterium]|nr:methyl-accepting chemotaxis protein [Marinilabiliaceae bacterium]